MKRKSTLRRLVGMTRPYGGLLSSVLVFSALSVALTLYAPILIGRGIDNAVGAGRVQFDALIPIMTLLAVTVAGTSAAQWASNLLINKIAYRMARDIRARAFEALGRAPVKYADTHRHGDILSRLVGDVDQISDGLLLGFSQLFTSVMTVLGTIAFMLSIDARIALIVIVLTPLSLLVARYIATHTYDMFKKQMQVRGEMTGLVNELVANQKLVSAFGYQARAQRRFDEINARLHEASLRAVFFSSITNPATRFVNSVVYVAVGVFGALAAIRGMISVGQLTSFLNYANQYTKPFNEISGVITEFQGALASAARVFELIDAPPEPEDAPDAVRLRSADGRVAFDDVSFSYRPEQTLIENLSLAAEPGQRIAIVGPTGSGKTTLINLLMRFYDVSAGQIRVSEHPVESIRRDSLRACFGMVLQETWLRSGTIRENIAYGKPEATLQQVMEAAKAAHADGFIRRLPEGYDTPVSEDGEGISQGQRQLLCIARAMLMAPPMLILDEATSSIDTLTEIRVQRAFSSMMRGRTSFVVAHRLQTIREADCILVMDKGRVIEQGTHEELLEKGGFYAALYQSQFSA
jgi:ATP-binding cassette subfamily B multidrug efflux pump